LYLFVNKGFILMASTWLPSFPGAKKRAAKVCSSM